MEGRAPLERLFIDDSGASTGTPYSKARDEINPYVVPYTETAHHMLQNQQK